MNKKTQGVGNFVWPEFKNDAERIKIYSNRYKNKTIVEAFNEVYNQQMDIQIQDVKELYVGKHIDVTIDRFTSSVTAKNVKESIILKQRDAKLRQLLNSIDENERFITTKGTVIELNSDGAVIDLIQNKYDIWLRYYKKTSKWLDGVTVECMNLESSRGGYTCKVKLLDGFEDVILDGFIPGSQIALNIEEDFSRWIGKNVKAQVLNIVRNKGEISIVCSRKKLLQVDGADYTIGKFEQKKTNLPYKEDLDGIVTGIINSSKRCGVFVEIPSKNITGMIEMNPSDIVKYEKGKSLKVRLDGFIYNTRRVQDDCVYDVSQYLIDEKTNRVIYCNLKPLFELV